MITHLHARSSYTLLQSTLSIKQLVQEAKTLGYDTIACTDKNVMHGAMEFQKECKKEGLKALFGMECEMVIDEYVVPMVILAKNNHGFQALIHMSSQVSDGKTQFSYEVFCNYQQDLAVILFVEGGIFEEACIKSNQLEIDRLIILLKRYISEFYLGLSYQESSFWKIRNQLVKEVACTHQVMCTALNKIYYAHRNDEEALRILNGIRLQKTINDKSLVEVSGRYMLSPFEMEQIYDQDDLKCSEMISDLCNVTLSLDKAQIPKFVCPAEISSAQFLAQLCIAGMKKRYGTQGIDEVKERLKYELDTIINMKFEDYFLIVWDFVRYSKAHQIYVGPGRGSAAGSLVAYCLGITHIDPIENGLLFERFLNPERISMPDIDIDFPDDRRDEVIQYVKEKYGDNRVAHIATFGTLGAKQVIRDVGRVMGVPLSKIDAISKAIPNAVNMTLARAMKESQRFVQFVNSSSQHIKLLEIAQKLEGLPRHMSMHAAGIVLSEKPLSEVVPTLKLNEDMLVTQYTMEHLEDLGLIKMDFLGLRNLTIIHEIVEEIKVKYPSFDILKIPLDNQKVYECLGKVDTAGIFQLESDGMRKLIQKMKPTNFEDVAVAIALYRPGPMQNIDLFLGSRANPDGIEYIHPDLVDILKPTYGVIIYQEQIMQIARLMAGFSLAKADILRKAMSKKNEKELLKLQNDFLQGCQSRGYADSVTKDVYDLILKFANYGFNKSHSYAYGLISYQMLYLKSNVPLLFFKSLLNSVMGSESKTAEYIDECRRRGVQVLGPSINRSSSEYLVEEGGLRFPLYAIKNVGINSCLAILKEREERGEFKDFYDFVARMLMYRFSQKVIESCIDAGTFDEFKVNRKSLRASLDEAISFANLVRIEVEGQTRIDLGLVSKPIMMSLKEDVMERSQREKQVLGFYFSSHPILQLKKIKNIQLANLAIMSQKNGVVQGFGMIQRVKQHRTKRGDLMAFVSVQDESSEFDLVFMPNTYVRYQEVLEKGIYLRFEGRKDKETSCIIQSCQVIDAE